MSDIILKAEAYVKEYFKNKAEDKFSYHNWKHTERMMASALEIADNSNVSPEDREILHIACLFHDTGYMSCCDKHEEIGAELADKFLKEENYPAKKITKVNACIMATKLDAKATTLLEKIIKDADLSSLGKKSYPKRAKELRCEWEKMSGKAFKDDEWIDKNITFLSDHKYLTDYAQKRYDPQKQKNIQKLMAEKEKKTEFKPGRGVETMFRVTLTNHIRLSAIADNKANIMLSINAIIISIVLSALMPKFDKNPHLVIPFITLISVCVATIILATISTLPKVTKGMATIEQIKDRSVNLLFFGNFHQMAFDDFHFGINEMIKDQQFLYDSLSKDLYNLGKVLHKKYKYLNWCYKVFMFGITISVIAFIIAISMMPEENMI